MMVLYGRIVDRTLRPMFPKGMINDTVVTITPLSCDRETDLAILGILGGSLTTLMAGIPFDGPVSGVRVGFAHKLQDNQNPTSDLLKINPTNPEFDLNGFNLLVSGKKGSINMIEMDGMEASEDMMESAFHLAQKATDELCVIQSDFLAKVKGEALGKTNMHDWDLNQFVVYNYPSDVIKAAVKELVTDADMDKFYQGTSDQWSALFYEYKERLRTHLIEKIGSSDEYRWENIDGALQLQVKDYYRRLILDNNVRIDGRAMDEVR